MKELYMLISKGNGFFGLPLLLILFFTSCGRHIHTDRSHYLKDGEDIPVVDLAHYRSVQERPGQRPDVAVAMSISGGGSRAANFAVGVMLGLEELKLDQEQDMLDQVDYISTVSGGGFAGGSYIAALYNHAWANTQAPFSLADHLKPEIEKNLTYSYTGALIRGNLNLLSYFSELDDGDALEWAVDNQVLGYRKRKRDAVKGQANRSILLGDLFIPANDTTREVAMPMLFTNSSVLSTMTIFPFSPDILERYYINGYSHRMKVVKEEFLDPYSVPLAVGIKASGSFPVLISNTTLSSYYHSKRKYLHLIDGALTDNSGYYTASQLLKQEQAPKKIILIVDAEAYGNRYTYTRKKGAYFSLRVYGRLAASGLEARKAILKKEVLEDAARFNFTPFFFSFSSLVEGNTAIPPEKINHKKEYERLTALMEENLEQLTEKDLQILYELVVQIGTKYTMTEKEQRLLFLTGRKLVSMRKSEILEALQSN